jgi:hypothetical protein
MFKYFDNKTIVLDKYREMEKKIELAVTKSFNYQMSVLKVRLVILRTLKS